MPPGTSSIRKFSVHWCACSRNLPSDSQPTHSHTVSAYHRSFRDRCPYPQSIAPFLGGSGSPQKQSFAFFSPGPRDGSSLLLPFRFRCECPCFSKRSVLMRSSMRIRQRATRPLSLASGDARCERHPVDQRTEKARQRQKERERGHTESVLDLRN